MDLRLYFDKNVCTLDIYLLFLHKVEEVKELKTSFYVKSISDYAQTNEAL